MDYGKWMSEMLTFAHYSPEQFDEIQKAYTNLVKYNKLPAGKTIVRKPVMDSWLRSKTNLPIEPDGPLQLKSLNDRDLKLVLKDNKTLMDSAIPILTNLNYSYPMSKAFGMSLYDKNGITLFVVNSALKERKLGDDLSEEAVGTTAHALCINSEKPLYLLSPENYHPGLRKPKVTFSLPIHDRKDRVIAALTIPYFKEIRYTKAENYKFSWMIAFSLMLAQNIELAIAGHSCNLHDNNGHLPFDAAMSLIDESIMSIDSDRKITFINSSGEVLFGTSKDKVIGKLYSDLLGKIPEIEKLYSNKAKTKNQMIQHTYFLNEHKYLIKAKPPTAATNEDSLVICISKLSANQNKRNSSTYALETIIGDSEGMLTAKRIAKKVANTSKSVLLLGESGTGKEVFAQAIHKESRSEKPFIAVNCAALPASLLESELFGYEAGAFTGADKKGHIGKIEMANGGTLFLDEIGDMPLELQAVLLRVLEDKKVVRIGGMQYIDVDFRVIAATNKDIMEMIREKKFREDLYYRIATFEISIPPLRQRYNDILKLARLFISEECSKMKIDIPTMDDDVVKKITQYEWPGNVRELKNAMDYALTMSVDKKITLDHLPKRMINEPLITSTTICKPIEELEKEAILSALAITRNNVKNASEILNLSRTTFYRKLKVFDINIKE